MVKQSLFIVGFMLQFIFTEAQEAKCVVQGNINGLGTRLLLMGYSEMPNGKTHYKLKFSHNDKIKFKVPVQDLVYAQIATHYKRKDHFRSKFIRLYLTPNDTIFIEGKLESGTIDYQANGNTYSEQYSELRKKMLPYLEKESKLYLEMMSKKVGKEQRAIIEKEFNNLRFFVEPPIRTQFAKEHLDYDISPLYFMNRSVPKDTTIKYLGLLGSNAKNSFFGKQMSKLVEGWSITKAGDKVPHFTAKILKGDTISISDFKGKYVILDFWGSWCGWCIKEFPKMKEYYNKYKDKLEIIGISCNDTESKWKKAVNRYNLNWIQILNNDKENDLSELFAVQAYPTKIVIDKKGNILQTFVGEKQEFYDLIDKLLDD